MPGHRSSHHSSDRKHHDKRRHSSSTSAEQRKPVIDHYSPRRDEKKTEKETKKRTRSYSPPSSNNSNRSDSDSDSYSSTKSKSYDSNRRTFSSHAEKNFVQQDRPNWKKVFSNNDKWIAHKKKLKKEKQRKKDEEEDARKKLEIDRKRDEELKRENAEKELKEKQRFEREKREDELERKKALMEEERFRRLESILKFQTSPGNPRAHVATLNENKVHPNPPMNQDLETLRSQLNHIQSLLLEPRTTNSIIPSTPKAPSTTASPKQTVLKRNSSPIKRKIFNLSPEHSSDGEEEPWRRPEDTLLEAMNEREDIDKEITNIQLLLKDHPRRWRSTLNKFASERGFLPLQDKEKKEQFIERLARHLLID